MGQQRREGRLGKELPHTVGGMIDSIVQVAEEKQQIAISGTAASCSIFGRAGRKRKALLDVLEVGVPPLNIIL